MRAIEGVGLDRRLAAGSRRGRFLEVGKVDFVEFRRIADEHERRRFAVVERDETVITAQVGGVDVVAGFNLERQFALPADTMRGFEVGDGKILATDLDQHFRLERFERRQRLADRHQCADDILATRFRQPRAAPIVE